MQVPMNALKQALCTAILSSLAAAAFAQAPASSADQAAVELRTHQDTEPLVITSIKVDGREVGTDLFPLPPGEPWLKTLSITVSNRTSKKIDGADLQMSFPETGTGSRENPVIGYQFQWGSTPASRINAPILGKPTPISLEIAPNAEAEIDLGEHYSEYATLLSSRMGSTAPHRVSLSVTLIDFADQIEWTPNVFYQVLANGARKPVDTQSMSTVTR